MFANTSNAEEPGNESEPAAPPKTRKTQSVVVLGLGRFGSSLATELELIGMDVLAIDKDPETVQRASEHLRHAIRADATDPEVLRQLAVSEYDCAVVSIGSDLAASILTTSVLLKLQGPEVWAKASSPQQGEILKQMGIQHIFYPESDMGRRAAHLVTHTFEDWVDLGNSFALVITKPAEKYCQDTLGNLDVRRRDGFSVIAVRGDNGDWETPHAGTVLRPDEAVMVVAPIKNINKIARP